MSSRLGNATAGYILPFVVFGLVIYTWYIYIFRVCSSLLLERTPIRVAQGVIFIVIDCVFWLLTLISYLRVLFSYPGKAIHVGTPSSYEATLPRDTTPRYAYAPGLMDLRTMEPTSVSVRNIPNRPRVSVSRSDGLPRYCEVCRCSKPDRTHHCKDCNACVLKMDHHCPWIGGCVGHYNYKFFYLFTLYTMLYAIWTFSSGLPLIVQALVYRDIELDPEWVVLIVLAFLFGALLIGFVGAHTYYILKNETTIEHISQRPTEVRVDFDESGHNYEVVTMHYNEKLWDVGYVLNWRAVMGRNLWTWFVPLTGALGNGCSFPFNEAVYNKIVERAKHQRDSLEPSAAHFNLQR